MMGSTGRRWHASRGFIVSTIRRRFAVHRLRVRFFYLIRFLCRWKFSPSEKATKLLKIGTTSIRNISCNSSSDHSNVKTRMVLQEGSIRGFVNSSSSYDSSDSFYSEAISDCLEFIKMSALSADEKVLVHP